MQKDADNCPYCNGDGFILLDEPRDDGTITENCDHICKTCGGNGELRVDPDDTEKCPECNYEDPL